MSLNRAKSPSESLWLLRTLLIFIFLRLLSIALHFLGPSPYGGPLVESPIRFIFNSMFIETGVILGLSLFYWLIGKGLRLHGLVFRIPFLLGASLYLAFAQLDLEFVRWLGEHVTLSFIKNYYHTTDGHMASNILKSDLEATIAAGVQMGAPLLLSFWLVSRKWYGSLKKRSWIILTLFFALLASSPLWFMQSDKRWRRIQPVAISMTTEIARDVLNLEKPSHPKQAYADLLEYIQSGHLADKPLDTIPTYPIFNAQGPGQLSIDEFKSLPRNQRPNIVYVTFETWRGWKTGLVHDTTLPSYTPILDSIIEHEAYYFPYTHSLGFPSVEGTQNIHLGTWPHFRKIVISNHLSIRWKSITEIFRDLGYKTEIFVGADPSFSNLTPWFCRWYEYVEYSEKYTQDGPLIDRFIAALDTIDREQPFFLSTWTVTTHPPYKIPLSEGIPIGATNEDRYNQAITYGQDQIVKLIDYLKQSDLWNNTVVVLVGDHAQPETRARNNTEIAGNFTPGHTWVHCALLGGWPGLPQPARHEETVSLIDMAPTLLEMVNVSVPNHFMGHSLLHPQSREFLSFRWNSVALHHETDRLLFDMFSNSMMFLQLDKKSKRNYALLGNHTMPKAETPPWPFDRERYRDMIFAFGQLLDQDRIFPLDERKRGLYVKRD